MQNKKSEKGITLIALAITVMVLSAISIPVIVNIPNISQFNKYTKFKNDIDILREGISIAYFDKDIKTIGPRYEGSLNFLSGSQNGQTIKNVNDNANYYVININIVNEHLKVNMNKLNYGEGNKNTGTDSYSGTTDVYIINEASRTIYYVKGIQYNGEKYYRLSEEFSNVGKAIINKKIITKF